MKDTIERHEAERLEYEARELEYTYAYERVMSEVKPIIEKIEADLGHILSYYPDYVDGYDLTDEIQEYIQDTLGSLVCENEY